MVHQKIMGGASSMERGGIRLATQAASVDSRTSSVRVCNLRLEGSLRRILPDEEQASQEEIHATLQEMATHYVAHALTDGQRRQFADRDVTPAEYLNSDLDGHDQREE